MFTTINEYINESFEVQTPKTKGDILDSADKVIKDHDWLVNSKPPLITDNQVSIQRRPSAFAPFRGIGTVKLTISQNLENTNIKCDIYPYDNYFPYIIILGIGLLTTWTVGGLLISTNHKNLLLILGLGWTAAILFTYISLLTNKKKLKNYSTSIIKELTK
jgi:hypothetical protein